MGGLQALVKDFFANEARASQEDDLHFCCFEVLSVWLNKNNDLMNDFLVGATCRGDLRNGVAGVVLRSGVEGHVQTLPNYAPKYGRAFLL